MDTKKQDGKQVKYRTRVVRAESDQWNAKYEVGQSVKYWSVAGEQHNFVITKTRSLAQVLGGHTAVVWVEGIAGCVALDHVRAVNVGVDHGS